MKKLNSKIVLDQLQFIVAGFVSSIVILTTVSIFSGTDKLGVINDVMHYLPFILTSLAFAVLVRISKDVKRISGNKSAKIHYRVIAAAVILSVLHMRLYVFPKDLFETISYSMIENIIMILVVALIFFSAFYQLRYAVSACVCVASTVIAFNSDADYFALLGITICIALTGVAVKFIFFRKWSNLVKEKNEL